MLRSSCAYGFGVRVGVLVGVRVGVDVASGVLVARVGVAVAAAVPEVPVGVAVAPDAPDPPVGVAVTVLSTLGYWLIPQYFWLWIAVFAGLPLIAVSVYLWRRR